MVLPLVAAGLASLVPTAIDWIENAFGTDEDDDEDYDDYEYTDEDEEEGNWWFW